MSTDGITISVTEDVTSVTVTEDVTTIDITPSVTTVEAKGISIANASAATAVTYQGLSNTNLAIGGNVAAALDHINTNGLNKNLDQTIDGNITFADGHTITFPTSGYTALELNDNSMNLAGITASADITSATKMEAPLFKGDLEGAVHFKATDSGTTLAKGDVVYITGYSGQRTTVDKADASDSAKMPAFGIVNAVTGSNVDVLTFGSMLSLSTVGIATGTELFVSATTPGGYETSAPTGEGNLIQKIAKVVRGDSASGSIKIMGAGRTNATPNLNDGNIFIGNSSNIPTTASFDTTFASSFATRFVDEDDMSSNSATKAPSQQSVKAYVDSQILTKDNTDEITEGSSNLYFTNARADARISNAIKDEDDMASDSATHVPSQQSVKAYVDAEVAGLVDSAPGTLNTLNELAAALGDDANFSTTVTDSIATKLPLAGGQMTGNITFSSTQTVDGRDLSVDGAKLDLIEAQADVTDTENVTAAGALMDSEVTNLAQVKAFDSSDYVAASAVSTFGGTLIDDTDAATARTTLGLGTAATTASTDYATSAQGTTADSALQPGDVVDNLTSTSTTTPLSAAQGKALQDNKQANLTFGIADDNAVEIDGTATSGDVAVFTANGITSSSTPTVDTITLEDSSHWKLSVDASNNLIFSFNGVNRMKLSSSGDLTVEGNITAFGDA